MKVPDTLDARIFVYTLNGAEFTFDESKDRATLAKHGLSLADAAAFEMAEAVVEPDERFAYTEARFRAFGRVDGEARCLVFTIRDGAVRAIGYRRAHEMEMRRHGR